MKRVLTLLLYIYSFSLLHGQDTDTNFDRQNLPDNSTKREEIQRYAGYEDLPLLYLTLFYDAVMGSNIGVSFMDIGFILLSILPLFLIWIKKNEPIARIVFLLFLGLFIFILFPSGFLSFHKIRSDQAIQFIQENPSSGHYLYVLTSNYIRDFFVFILPSFIKIETWLRQFESSYGLITYPSLIGLFLFLLICGTFILRNLTEEVVLFSFLIYFYLFLWVLLSSGITWYGIIALPLGLILIFLKKAKWIIGLVLLQLSLHFPYRISRYESFNAKEGQMFESAASGWLTGQISDAKYTELLTGIPLILLDYLNRDLDSKIYKVGTNLHFFIKQNDQRIFQDNQLGHFKIIIDSKKDVNSITKSLKKNGFKFIMVDLAIQNMDQTPEKSFQNKHRLFLDFINNNPGLRLLYTDRIILDETSKTGIPGIGTLNSRVFKQGKLAIFEIL
jgi:hypothetical protein